MPRICQSALQHWFGVILRATAEALVARWWGLVAVATQDSLAATLLGDAPHLLPNCPSHSVTCSWTLARRRRRDGSRCAEGCGGALNAWRHEQ